MFYKLKCINIDLSELFHYRNSGPASLPVVIAKKEPPPPPPPRPYRAHMRSSSLDLNKLGNLLLYGDQYILFVLFII